MTIHPDPKSYYIAFTGFACVVIALTWLCLLMCFELMPSDPLDQLQRQMQYERGK